MIDRMNEKEVQINVKILLEYCLSLSFFVVAVSYGSFHFLSTKNNDSSSSLPLELETKKNNKYIFVAFIIRKKNHNNDDDYDDDEFHRINNDNFVVTG